MFKTANLAIPALLLFCACRQPAQTERAETTYWKAQFIDSSYKLLYENRDTARALCYFDSLFKQSGQSSVYAKAARFDLLANYHYFFSLNNLATAVMIDSALALYNTTELQNHYARTYVGLLLFGGQIAYRLTQYNKANDYYFKAKKLADAHLNHCERTSFNYNIAMVLYRQQYYRQSGKYFEEAYALQNTCASQTTAVALQQQEIQSNIGLCLLRLNDYDSAMIHFNKALQIANLYKDSLGAATMDKIYGVIDGNKARVSMAKNRLNEAEQFSLQSIALNDRDGYEKDNALEVKLLLADIYYRQKNFASMADLLGGLTSSIKQAAPKMQMEWKRLMATYYEQTGHADTALQYLRSYFLLRDSIATEQRQLTAADVTRQLLEKEQESQISLLKKDNQMAKATLWVTIIFSGMTLAILFLIYYNYRRNKKNLAVSLALYAEIKKQKDAREEEVKQRHKLITEAVINAQENERSAIGLELHDNINQVLTTVKLHNEMVLEGMGDADVLLRRASGYLQNCINEIRSLSKRLSAPTLGKISLEEAVKDLIDSVNVSSKVKITRCISGLDNQLLKQDLHLGVYRILQEQLNNVLKHADASEVTVHLQQNKGTLRLAVTDNGKGFLVDEQKSGIGLINMQTRAENLNGTFALHSKPGNGCTVEVVIPCN